MKWRTRWSDSDGAMIAVPVPEGLNETIERAARKMASLVTEPGANPDSRMVEMIHLARAALEEMREPTEAMVCAGDEQIIAALHDLSGVLRDPTPARASWQAMIDEALK